MQSIRFGGPITRIEYGNGHTKILNPDNSVSTIVTATGKLVKHVNADPNIKRGFYELNGNKVEVKKFLDTGIIVYKRKSDNVKTASFIDVNNNPRIFLNKNLATGLVKFVGEESKKANFGSTEFDIGQKNFSSYAKDVIDKLGTLLGFKKIKEEVPLNLTFFDNLEG